MINLIPQTAKRYVVREYWLRVITSWLFLISIVGLLVAILCLPSYVLLTSLDRSMAVKIDDARAVEEKFRAAEKEVKETNALLIHVADNSYSNNFSNIIKELDDIAGPNIEITRINLKEEAGSVDVIALSGVALNRTSLAQFRSALEGSSNFESVELPISNLAQESNIIFSLTVSLSEPAKEI